MSFLGDIWLSIQGIEASDAAIYFHMEQERNSLCYLFTSPYVWEFLKLKIDYKIWAIIVITMNFSIDARDKRVVASKL